MSYAPQDTHSQIPMSYAPQADLQRIPEVQQLPEVQIPREAETAQKDLEQRADLGQASQMVEMLKNSGNSKFANSAFVQFIDRVSKGDLTFENNKVFDSTGQELDWDTLYDAEFAESSQQDVAELDKLWHAAGKTETPTMLPEGELASEWNNDLIDQVDDVLLDKWNSELENAWNEATLGPETESFWNNPAAANQASYAFSADNSFCDTENPLEVAQRLIAEGRDREAIQALEAEVQRNPESSEGWRQLGELWAQMDQDVEAIQCLRKGHEVDPYNLDSLLALGVSCTNELDQVEALKYLRSWIEHHDDFADLLSGLAEPTLHDLEILRQQVTDLFHAASDRNPTDADVFVALGVIENINRNYGAASLALAQACRLRPNDSTCWNKLGATLANSGRSEDALICYHQALSLKPNYPRTWANFAIAHANLGEHLEAARFYISSLTLNPSATHIWTFLHTAMLNAGKFDPAITNRDLETCKRIIPGSIELADIPQPAELSEPPDMILHSIAL